MIVDIPVNAGAVASAALMLTFPVLLAAIFLTAVVTKVTVEITREDGTVEVVNKIIEDTVSSVKDKAQDVKDKAQDIKNKAQEVKDNFTKDKEADNSFQYTVKFEDEDKDKDSDK